MRNLFYFPFIGARLFKRRVESVSGSGGAVRGLGLLHCFLRASAMVERTKKPCLRATLLLFFLLLVSAAAHGAQLAGAKGAAAADDDRVTVRTGHGHGHGYSSHSGGHPNGGTPEMGGAGVVDPRNLNARSHHHRGAASRALGYSSWLICTLVGVAVLLLQ